MTCPSFATKEQGKMAAKLFSMISRDVGILVLAIFGNHLDLMHVLLGTVLSLSRESLIWISSVSSLSLLEVDGCGIMPENLLVEGSVTRGRES